VVGEGSGAHAMAGRAEPATPSHKNMILQDAGFVPDFREKLGADEDRNRWRAWPAMRARLALSGHV